MTRSRKTAKGRRRIRRATSTGRSNRRQLALIGGNAPIQCFESVPIKESCKQCSNAASKTRGSKRGHKEVSGGKLIDGKNRAGGGLGFG